MALPRLPGRRLDLTWRFALTALVAFVLLGCGLIYFFNQAILNHALHVLGDEAQDIVASRLLPRLSAEDLEAPFTGQRLANFDRFVVENVLSQRMVHVKLWSREGRVIYSDDWTEIGKVFPSNHDPNERQELEKALGGRTAPDVSHLSESPKEGEGHDIFLEVYTPVIFPGSNEVAGVFEVYQVYAPVLQDAQEMQVQVAGGLASGLALLYVCLLGIVRGAAQTIERQRAGLADALDAEREARVRAEAAVRAREEFLSIAAHELNTPLTGLRGFTQFLQQIGRAGPVDAVELSEVVDALDHSSQRLARLVERLLDVTRLERGELRLERQETDLASLVLRTVEAAQRTTGRHDLSLRGPSRATALVDPLRLEQVLTNLLDNAIKYSPDGGAIDVAVADDGPETVRLAVRDRGLGIPPEQRPHIFDRFFRAHGQKHYGGMGLGLYISQQIVEQHGGELLAEFPEDGGTRMVVRLPARLAPTMAAAAEVAR